MYMYTNMYMYGLGGEEWGRDRESFEGEFPQETVAGRRRRQRYSGPCVQTAVEGGKAGLF